MNGWFDSFNDWFDDWFEFRDDLDALFSGSSSETKKELSVAAIYAIENYKNFKIEVNYLIIKRAYSQNETFAYYKLGLTQPKPLRIVFNA